MWSEPEHVPMPFLYISSRGYLYEIAITFAEWPTMHLFSI